MELEITDVKLESRKASSNELKKRVQDYKKIYGSLEELVSQNYEKPISIQKEITPNIYSYLI